MILFYDREKNVLLQDRREISKHGEEYGFFGGKIEEGETPAQALKREVKEELSIDLLNYKLFKHYRETLGEIDMDVERWVFLAKLPNLDKVKIVEGQPKLINIKDSFDLKMVPGDIELLKEISTYLDRIL